MSNQIASVSVHSNLAVAAHMAEHFPDCGQVLGVRPLGRGLINATFEVRASQGHFVLQRINSAVFPNPALIMDNLSRLQQAAVTESIVPVPRLPHVFPAQDGSWMVHDEQTGDWRLLELIPDASNLPRVENPSQAAEIGRVLAGFHRFGAQLPVANFHVTLPSSHDTLGYRASLDRVLESDAKVTTDALAVVEQVRARDGHLGSLRQACDAGVLRKTVIHGDPKRDNILFDTQGRNALCLIDFDTVQPGLMLHDIGDCLRSCCNRAGEGAAPDEVHFDLELAGAVLGAYLREAPDVLSVSDKDLLFDAIRLIPLELAIRFLVDHLRGNLYFRVRYRGQNLDKAIAQLALVADIERQEGALRRMLEKIDGGAGHG